MFKTRSKNVAQFPSLETVEFHKAIRKAETPKEIHDAVMLLPPGPKMPPTIEEVAQMLSNQRSEVEISLDGSEKETT